MISTKRFGNLGLWMSLTGVTFPAEVDSLAEQLSQETNATVQYKIGHIQLRFSDDKEKSAVEAEAKALAKKLNEGADFTEMAYTYSKGPKALQGGDWGWMEPLRIGQ